MLRRGSLMGEVMTCIATFKILLLGEVGVGKSRLIATYLQEAITPDPGYSTIGVEYYCRQEPWETLAALNSELNTNTNTNTSTYSASGSSINTSSEIETGDNTETNSTVTEVTPSCTSGPFRWLRRPWNRRKARKDLPPRETELQLPGGIRPSEVEGAFYRMQCWDTSGQERFRSIVASYYRHCHGVMLVCDLQRRSTLEALPTWWEEFCIKSNVPRENIALLIVGNKSDLPGTQATTEELIALARRLGGAWCLTSCYSTDSVMRAFRRMAIQMLRLPIVRPPNSSGQVHLRDDRHEPTEVPAKTICCWPFK